MSWFVDASIVVAIVGREAGWEAQADRLDSDSPRYWSAVARWESIAGLRKRIASDADTAREMVDAFAAMNGFELVAIGSSENSLAFDAYRAYGKASGHPAQLNMGDCFAYAGAKANGARLLYQGNDFVHTDLA
ncbi:MAG: type II toxin-antitoxin system VapC family toxin [Sphingomonadales bacterium]|nr:type II toxin-antitoxin system VapC family toxin [Sphingomonadales bacterium]